MKIINARIPMGRTAVVQEVELYSREEARNILQDKNWEIGIDIYSIEFTNKRIGWLASFENGDGIYIET